MRLFSHVLVIFTVIQNERLATNSQNAILNNIEEYYNIVEPQQKYRLGTVSNSLLWDLNKFNGSKSLYFVGKIFQT